MSKKCALAKVSAHTDYKKLEGTLIRTQIKYYLAVWLELPGLSSFPRTAHDVHEVRLALFIEAPISLWPDKKIMALHLIFTCNRWPNGITTKFKECFIVFISSQQLCIL